MIAEPHKTVCTCLIDCACDCQSRVLHCVPHHIEWYLKEQSDPFFIIAPSYKINFVGTPKRISSPLAPRNRQLLVLYQK